jgi:hypothetical protein
VRARLEQQFIRAYEAHGKLSAVPSVTPIDTARDSIDDTIAAFTAHKMSALPTGSEGEPQPPVTAEPPIPASNVPDPSSGWTAARSPADTSFGDPAAVAGAGTPAPAPTAPPAEPSGSSLGEASTPPYEGLLPRADGEILIDEVCTLQYDYSHYLFSGNSFQCGSIEVRYCPASFAAVLIIYAELSTSPTI